MKNIELAKPQLAVIERSRSISGQRERTKKSRKIL